MGIPEKSETNLIDKANSKLVAKIANELQPFLDKIRQTPKEELYTFKKSYERFQERYEKSWDIIMHFSVGYLLEIKKKSPTTSEISAMFSYLGFVETVGNTLVDFLVMVMVANRIDFHIESFRSTPRIKHALSIDDLEKEYVPLKAKLNFLADNGVKSFASVVNSRLRNDIAHLHFDLEKGKIRIRNKPVFDAIFPCTTELIDSVSTIYRLLSNLAKDLGWK